MVVSVPTSWKLGQAVLAAIGFFPGVFPDVHFEIAFLKELETAEGADEVAGLVQVCVPLVKTEAWISRVWFAAPRVRADKSFLF